MRLVKSLLAALLLLGLPVWLNAAEMPEAGAAAEGAVKESGLPAAAPQFHLGPLVFTSSTVVTWIVALGLILFAQIATQNVKLVPERMQNFCEWLVEGLYDFFESVLGPDLVKKSFWFFATIFVFILFTNWFGLVPGVGTVGWGHETGSGFHVSHPLLRGGNADLNMTVAMALTFFALWIWWSFDMLGVVGTLKHIFVGEGGGTGAMKWFMIAVFFFVGVIEVLSIAFRPVSLSFRLFGNIFAGENILEAMMNLIPAFGWILPLPFYFLELLVGAVQALVFALLTAVFTALMVPHGHADDKGHGHDGKGHGAHSH